MTHDKQKLEYLLSQLKADNTGRYRVITNAGNIEDWCLLSLVEDYKNLDLDATAAANGIEWPIHSMCSPSEIVPDKPRMFTEQEMEEYNNLRLASSKIRSVNDYVEYKNSKNKILDDFCKKIVKQQDCPSEFIDIVNKEFWNLI